MSSGARGLRRAHRINTKDTLAGSVRESIDADLVVLTGAEPVVITQVQRDSDGDGFDEVNRNTAPEAESIRATVDVLVAHDAVIEARLASSGAPLRG